MEKKFYSSKENCENAMSLVGIVRARLAGIYYSRCDAGIRASLQLAIQELDSVQVFLKAAHKRLPKEESFKRQEQKNRKVKERVNADG